MFDKLRTRLTYANVVSTLALFLVLGTGGVYAAAKLKNNSVTSKKIKDGQVANVDLGPDAVTGPKVGDGALTGADVGDETLTGADLVESSLQGVDAGAVGGLQLRKIRFRTVENSDPATNVLNLGGLVITAVCRNFGDTLDVKAYSTKNFASATIVTRSLFVNDTDGTIDFGAEYEPNFSSGGLIELDNEFPGNGTGVGTLHYEAPDGSVVVVHLALDESALVFCEMTGIAIGG